MSQNYFRQFEFNSNFHESNRKTVDFQVTDLDDGLNNAKGKEGGTEPHNNNKGESGLGKNGSICLFRRRRRRRRRSFGRYFRRRRVGGGWRQTTVTGAHLTINILYFEYHPIDAICAGSLLTN